MLAARRAIPGFAVNRHNFRFFARSVYTRHSVMETVTGSASTPSTTPAAGNPQEPEVYSDRWEMLWAEGLQPGQRWDASGASPSLKNLLASGKVDVHDKRVLVPGCGRGYDLPVFFAAGAREAVGLELSATATREAEAYLDQLAAAGGREAAGAPEPAAPEAASSEAVSEGGAAAQPQLPQSARGAVRCVQGDFFAWTDAQGNGSYDVGYDYTFGCAMHPSMRQDWAAHWARQLRAGGLLVTLVFPIDPAADPQVGPPFPVSPQLYTELLTPAGFECVYHEPVPAELSHPSRAGREEMMLWRKH